MFKKIQNYLLINYPLLWNIKIVPMASFLIVFNIIFFFLGYVSGEIDFTTTGGNYYKNNQEIILFFGVLISILLFIVWLVFYLKNNGFKSFYPKRNNSLFKEWFIIFSLLILISSFSFSFLFGSDLRVKSYYSEKEATKRCATLAKASLFLGYTYDGPQYVDKMINDTLQSVPLDHVLFNNKKYSLESLINKDIENFSFFLLMNQM